MKDPVQGTAQVVSSSNAPRSTHGNCHMTLVVTAPGVEPFSVKHHALVVPTDRWPWPGMSIPVTVDRANPEKVDIDWDEVPRVGDTAMDEADAMVEALKQGGSGDATVPAEAAGMVAQLQQLFPGATVQVEHGSSAEVPPEMVGQVEQALGVDLDGDGVVGPAGTGSSCPASGSDDRIAQLERLTALRDGGSLSDAEFEAEKQRLLSG